VSVRSNSQPNEFAAVTLRANMPPLTLAASACGAHFDA